jgi:hypothetical protein
VGEGFSTAVHCRQREPKEPHFSRGHEAVGPTDYNTSTVIHHRWLHQGRDLCISQQCHLPYNIKPFTDEVLCDVSPLEVCDVLLGQPYLWKRHVVYESRPHSVIITLGNKLYRIPEVAPPTTISLITAKKCSKIISQTRKFVFLMIHPQGKKKVVATASRQGSSTQQQQMDKVMEEYRDIFSSPTGVPLHCQVKHSIDLTPGMHHYPMDRSIDALFWRTMRSRGRFRSCCRKGTSGQAHHPVGARLYWYRRRMGPGDSVLTIGH